MTPENNVPELFPKNNFKQPFKERSSTINVQKKREILTPVRRLGVHKEKQAATDSLAFEADRVDPPVLQPEPSPGDVPAGLIFKLRDGDYVGTVPGAVKEVTVKSTEVLSESGVFNEHSYFNYGNKTQPLQNMSDKGIQTDIDKEFVDELEQKIKNVTDKLKDEDSLMRTIFISKVKRNDKSVNFYTGVPSLHMLDGLFQIFDNYEKNLKYWRGSESIDVKQYELNENLKPGPKRKLTRYEEYILTLVRLRQAIPERMLADLFGISVSSVSKIFTTWVNYMSTILKNLIIWPKKELVKKHMPKAFKKSFPNTRAIIDCTEIYIERPRNPTTQSKTYSNYKSHNTYKSLVSISPNGCFNFISKLYGGNTSDRYITEHSGFLDLVSKGDEIMADRGFLIRDLLLERKAYLNIPPFTRKCGYGKGRHLSASDIRKTRKIANVRIYVEQAIQRLKQFKMLSQILRWTQRALANPMMIIAAFLCNLKKPLVKK